MKNRIRELRQKKKLTQKELADIIDVKKLTISRWENAEDVSLKQEKATQLSNLFGVTVDYLLGHVDEPHKHMSDLVHQNPEHFPSDEDGFQDITPQGLVDASLENNNRYFYIENITHFVKDKKTTNSKLKLLSDLVDTFKKS